MAKIPRIERGNRPSSVPQGPLPGQATTGAGELWAAADVANTGYKIAADAEHQEALKLRAVTEAKQAVDNEISAGRAASAYEETLFNEGEKLKIALADTPEKAPAQLLALGRKLSEEHARAQDNAAVGLQVAQRTGSRLDSAVREMHTWASSRQSQKIKNNLDAELNTAAAQAEHKGSVQEVEKLIQATEKQYGRLLTFAFGAQADEKLKNMKANAVEGYFRVQGDQRPLSIMRELDDPKGPAGKYLTSTQRDSLRKQTEASSKNRSFTRILEIAKTATGEDRETLDLLDQGKLTPEAMLGLQRKTAAAIKAAAIDPRFTAEQQAEHVAVLKKRLEVQDAIEDIRAMGTRYAPEEAVTNEKSLMDSIDKALKKIKGQGTGADLLTLSEQMDRIVLARRKKTITETGFQTMRQHISLVQSMAFRNEQADDGPWLWFNESRQEGNQEQNRLFGNGGPLFGQPLDVQVEARKDYMAAINQHRKDNPGKLLSHAEARILARRAAALAAGKQLPDED